MKNVKDRYEECADGWSGWIIFILLKYWLLVFYVAFISYLELVYRLWSFKGLSLDYVFSVIFALSSGAILFLISSFFEDRINRMVAELLILSITFVFIVQLLYFTIFHTPFSIYSMGGAGEAMQFEDVIFSAIFKNLFAILLLSLPFILFYKKSRKKHFAKLQSSSFHTMLLFIITSYTFSMMCVNRTDENIISQHSLYYSNSSPELSVMKLGLLTTMRLDMQRLAFGSEPKDNELSDMDDDRLVSEFKIKYYGREVNNTPTTQVVEYNKMNIDFQKLIDNEKDQVLLGMHKYFSSSEPTKKNEYTGMFKGNNLIFITAEAFSSYAVDLELTPTLYQMASEGFVFNNFYNPVWGVSTSDGEYVACTGLIPKSGVWSFEKSGKNLLPFVMGNQFKRLNYITKAYHDHSYTYYKRDISHPNMGYDYKGVGNGLKLKNTWPESDLEMIDVTAKEYISSTQPFHTYFMTVSGHMNYSFTGNYIAEKNKSLVEHLKYSEPSKAYIACNIELEFAMKALIEKLEAAGIADKTVIAISADHYPYGLPRQCIDELAGHKVENNFELYQSTFILWKKGMKPIVIDKACSSLDIIPTLSNLFGLEYDSRLLMGNDILSDAPSLVIFSNHSWITDKAMYNAVQNSATFMNGANKDPDYIAAINKIVADKFKYSTKLLEKDYYRKVISR